MPMWSVTEERVIELERQMKEKKQAYDALLATPIATLWVNDLDHFLEELDEYERQEEADRLAHGGMKNEGGKRRKAAKKGGDAGKKKEVKMRDADFVVPTKRPVQKPSQQTKLTTST
jgi:hypothetical protein